MLPIALLLLVFVPMILEARRSLRHERVLRAAGAVEPPGDVLAAMQVAYPLCFLAPIGEAWFRGRTMGPLVIAGGVLFTLAKALKYWAIATLGERWTFRVLVPPASPRTVAGPYAFLRHPNYVAVVGEIAGVALMAQAPVTGLVAMGAFLILLWRRIGIEERALGLAREPKARV